MGKRPSIHEIEQQSGIRCGPDETITEYFRRDEFRAIATEREIAAVRNAILRDQFAQERALNQDEQDAIESFYTKLAEYEPPSNGSDTGIADEGDGDLHQSDSEEPPSTGENTDQETAAESTNTAYSSSEDVLPTLDPVDTDAKGPSSSTRAHNRSRGVAAIRSRYRELKQWALSNPHQTRALLFVLLLLCAVPVGIANASYTPAGAEEQTGAAGTIDTSGTNITFIAAQGTETGFGPGIFAYNDAGELVWSHNQYFRKYFDVDPIGDDKVLFTAQKHRWSNESAGYPWVAAVYNWRTDTLVREFPVPPVTHDVDYLGGETYITANLQSHLRDEHHDDFVHVAQQRGWIPADRQNFSHNLYQLNLSTGTIEWEYRFKEHFPRSAGSGYSKGYTHLNDVDVVDNGTAVLASPRNFDRVVLIDKETKELRWTLGAEDNYDILNEQHNPVLLQLTPPVVVVADSENRRAIEYQRLPNGTWAQTWKFEPLDLAETDGFGTKDLQWPRDADRLPNGNTLITASGAGHVVEVTPDKEVVWSVSEIEKVYEAERLRYGDEPQGPPMTELRDVSLSVEKENTAAEESGGLFSVISEYYTLASWVLPAWVTQSAFYSLHLALILGLIWSRFEWLLRRRTTPL